MMKNKMKARIITSAMIAAMLVPSTTAFAATTFTDVKQSDWYYSTVTKLADTGIVNGTGDGSFNPNGEVSSDSFIKMLVMARNMDINSELGSVFWSKPYLQSAYENGFGDLMYKGITYYTPSDTKYYDSFAKPLTREKMAALISKALELDGKTTDITNFDTTAYTDFTSIDNKYNTAVRSVIINGIMNGKDGGKFDPQGTVTRAEAATVIARYMYPEERLTYNYTQNEEKHNTGDIYTDYNTWVVPTEVKLYETGQAIPTICANAMLYVEELGKYIYVGMPVKEIESIMGSKAIQQEGFNNYKFYQGEKVALNYSIDDINGKYIESYSIYTPYNASYNGHSLGEAPLLEGTYKPREEYSEYFTNGGLIDNYPYISGVIKKGDIIINYIYGNNGYTETFLKNNNIPADNEKYHLPTETSRIYITSTRILKALGAGN